MPSPIALFAFNRPQCLQATLKALAANTLAWQSMLTIFCDGPRDVEEQKKTDAVRDIARQATGFASVTLVEREQNQGLAASIITGVSAMLEKYGQVIVVEDDLRTSPHFLSFMNDGLQLYKDDTEVASICGWSCPGSENLQEKYFFLRGADCLGWATWSRAWAHFNADARFLYEEILRKNLQSAFNYDSLYNFTEMLKATADGSLDSWAIRWYASAFLKEMLTLYPSTSFVFHDGAQGTHIDNNAVIEQQLILADKPICLSRMPIAESSEARSLMSRWHTRQYLSNRAHAQSSPFSLARLRGEIGRRFPTVKKIYQKIKNFS